MKKRAGVQKSASSHKKWVWVYLALMIFVFVSLGMSAFTFRGIFDTWNLITGAATSSTTSASIVVNSVPRILFVLNGTPQTISEGTSIRINFSFIANDSDTAGDLNNATAKIQINRTNETTRYNATCHALALISSGIWQDSVNFSCSVFVWYFDGAGVWNINASILDDNNVIGENSTSFFNIQSTTAMNMYPTSLTWPAVDLGAVNQTANNDPIVINNTGNDDIDVGGITFLGNDLQGVSTTTEFIRAANFSVSPRNGTNSCSGTSCFECNGTTFANNTYTPVGMANLTANNNTPNNHAETTGQEELFFCLRQVAPEISRQTYTTSAGSLTNVWTIAIS